jgi:hypothetical protein
MNRWLSTAWIAAVALPIALIPAASTGSPAAPVPEATPAGCLVTFKAHNNGRQQVAISRDSQVRARSNTLSLPWKKLGLSEWIQPGQTRSWTYNLDLGCKVTRQYRFIVKKFDANRNLLSTVNFYWPVAQNGVPYFTQYTRIDLGDLNRYF